MVREDMKFIGYRAFYKVRYSIKEKYDMLCKCDKVVYKYYVYSRRQMKEYTCDLIWGFLNSDETVTNEMLKVECTKYRM